MLFRSVGAVKQRLPANDICANPCIAVCRALVDAGAAGTVQISQAAGRVALLHLALGCVPIKIIILSWVEKAIGRHRDDPTPWDEFHVVIAHDRT